MTTTKTLIWKHVGKEETFDRCMIHPDDIYRFFHQWYQELHCAGVDMVKVDNQASMEVFSDDTMSSTGTMRDYQLASQGAAATHFRGNILHCMCHLPEIAYNMKASVAWRNSDDFFPDREESHQFHVHANAMNNLWSAQFSIPDWDMFHSSHPAGAFHAAARAISGGPIYVSDKPGQHDFSIIRKLCTGRGEILRSNHPALPAKDCLFTDCLKEKKLLKITNKNGQIGVMGVFHCNGDPEKQEICDFFAPSDIPAFVGEKFAVYYHNSKELFTLGRDEKREIKLPFMGFELLTLSPIDAGIAPLGLVDKYNGSRAIEGFTVSKEHFAECTVTEGGVVGFWCQYEPKAVYMNGAQVPSRYQSDSGLLEVETERGETVVVGIEW